MTEKTALCRTSSRDVDISTLMACVEKRLHDNEQMLVTFVNPHSFHLVSTVDDFQSLLEMHDFVMPDGIGIVWAARCLGHPGYSRMSFDMTSLAPTVFAYCAQQKIPVAFIGGRPGVVERAVSPLLQRFDLKVGFVADGYQVDWDGVYERLEESGSRVLVCGMGAPLQERFISGLKERKCPVVAFTCGGFMDQLNPELKYYPRWVDRCNLRFLYRLIREPVRLSRRYLVEYQPFLAWFFRELISPVKRFH